MSATVINRGGVTFTRTPTGKLLVGLPKWVPLKRHSGYTKMVTQPAPIQPAEMTQRDATIKGRKPNPKRITMALDARGLYGPEVDEALGVREPAVDCWETGIVTPTSEQIARLSTLTGYAIRFFYDDDPPSLDYGWMCGTQGCQPLRSDDPNPANTKPCVVFQ